MAASTETSTIAADERGARRPGLAEQAQLLRSGEASSRELVETALERAEESQPTLNAFRVICAEEALAAAAEADRNLAAGGEASLLGVPVAIKDDVDLAGRARPARS
jgi:amidase